MGKTVWGRKVLFRCLFPSHLLPCFEEAPNDPTADPAFTQPHQSTKQQAQATRIARELFVS